MKTAIIEVKEKEYKFCLNREAIKWLESRGVVLADIDKKTVTCIDEIWMAGLVTNHPDMTQKEALSLMDEYKEESGDVSEIIQFLIEQYGNFISALTDTSSKKKKKKAKIVG